ncbi:MAG TPA: class I SAM-dependent methyltransferase [Longimicrobiaceae bacterium]|jgi:ubiquinone/menaquinone biosynthesis C-methylase UbiE|nr:class I SAM-dependent methyltransferase [Longimicrobiaceae bacterium]
MIDKNLNYGRHVVRRFLEQARPFSTLLDLGAGTGVDLRAAREVQPDAELHAIEVWPESVRTLEGMGVRVHPIDLEKNRFPLADGSMDVVMSNQVLEHTKEIFWIFHEATRVLRTGGHMIVGVPNLASLHNRLLLLLGRQPSALQNATAHVRGYTRRDIVRFVDRVFPGGYSVRAFGGSNFYPFPPAIARPLAKALPGMAWGIFLLLRKEREYGREFVEYPVRERLETNFFLGT